MSAPLLTVEGGLGTLPKGLCMSDNGDSKFFQALLGLLGGRSPVLIGGTLGRPDGGFLRIGLLVVK